MIFSCKIQLDLWKETTKQPQLALFYFALLHFALLSLMLNLLYFALLGFDFNLWVRYVLCG